MIILAPKDYSCPGAQWPDARGVQHMAEDAVLRELEQMRGELGRLSVLAGEISTSCAVLISRSDRTERDLRDLRKEKNEDVDELRQEIEALKERRWPLGVVGAVAGVMGTLIAGFALLMQQM